MAENEVEQPVVEEEAEGTPAIFLRKVDVVIQNEGDEEPRIIKADETESAEEQRV